MKRQIRFGVFETNSSSTHSLQICTKDEFNRWVNGELLLDSYNDNFVTADSIKTLTEYEKKNVKEWYDKRRQKYWKSWDELTEEEHEELYKEELDRKLSDSYRYKTHNDYMYYGDLETFTQSYTSPSGDELVAFGYYGYDG